MTAGKMTQAARPSHSDVYAGVADLQNAGLTKAFPERAAQEICARLRILVDSYR